VGGWAPASVAGDRFKLGSVLESGALLLGRKTWDRFSRVWPQRHDDFSKRMNAVPKLVASRSLYEVDGWSNSSLLQGDLVQEVTRRKQEQDLVVMGSASVVRTLMERDLVDEYRLLVFPRVLGEGGRLFEQGTAPIDLRLASAEPAGAALLLVDSRQPAARAQLSA